MISRESWYVEADDRQLDRLKKEWQRGLISTEEFARALSRTDVRLSWDEIMDWSWKQLKQFSFANLPEFEVRVEKTNEDLHSVSETEVTSLGRKSIYWLLQYVSSDRGEKRWVWTDIGPYTYQEQAWNRMPRQRLMLVLEGLNPQQVAKLKEWSKRFGPND